MMLNALLRRKNFICLFSDNLLSPRISHVPFSLPVLSYFSTSRESNAAVYDLLKHKHQFSHEVASHAASVLTPLNSPEKYDSVLSFFKDFGFTMAQLERALKIRPHLLAANLEKIIKPKIQIFQDFGFPAEDIAHVISSEPIILHVSFENRVIPALSLLKGLLGSTEKVMVALKRSRRLLFTDMEKIMVPNVEMLKSCGLNTGQITKLLNFYPRLLLYKPETLRKCLDNVDKLRVNWSSRMSVCGIGIVCSMTPETWERKLQAFRNVLEFSEDDILRALRLTPLAFTASEEKMKKVKASLLGTEKYDISCIAKYPRTLKYSIERRYEPRFEVLKILESKHLIKKWPSLGMIEFSDGKFFKRYVAPYINEVGDAYPAQRALNYKGDVKPISEA